MSTRREFVRAVAAAQAITGPASLCAGDAPKSDAKRLAKIPAGMPILVGALDFPQMDQIDLTGREKQFLHVFGRVMAEVKAKATLGVANEGGVGLLQSCGRSYATRRVAPIPVSGTLQNCS